MPFPASDTPTPALATEELDAVTSPDALAELQLGRQGPAVGDPVTSPVLPQRATEEEQVRDVPTAEIPPADHTPVLAEQPASASAEEVHPGTENEAQAPPTRAVRHVEVHADHNDGTLVGQWFEAVQRHSGAELASPWVDEQLSDYVPIEGEAETVEFLRKNKVLVLVADRLGSGRWTAALRLLRLVDEELTLRRVRRDPGDGFSMEGLRGKKNTGWILDLRATDEHMPSSCEFGLELLTTADLEDDDSYLVVLIGTDLWNTIGHDVGELARVPKVSDLPDLFVEALRSAGSTKPELLASHHRFAKDVPRLLPGQIRDWARTLALSESQYLATIGARELDGDGVDIITTNATHALSGWMDVLGEWHAHANRTSYDRNYLLLVAVYDGAPIDGVHTKIASLAAGLGEKGERADSLSGQQGPGLIQLARQIEAEPLSDGSVRFPGPGFAEAAVRYFWRDRPELIDAFTKWTARLCLELKHPQGTELAARMAPWVLHHVQATRTTVLLRLVVTGWAEDKNLTPHAHALLVAASLDPLVGELTRKATRKWTTDQNTPAGLRGTLAGVFESLAPAYPQSSLRRLGELALSRETTVAAAVGKAINSLWSNDELHPKLHSLLTTWFASTDQSLRSAAASAFMNLTLQCDENGRPTLLGEADGPPPGWVIDGWRTALEAQSPTPLARQACIAWLDAAAAHGQVAEPVMTTLVRAVHDVPSHDLRGQRFLNLVRLAEQWILRSTALDEEGRERFRTDLVRRAELADPLRLRPQGDVPGA